MKRATGYSMDEQDEKVIDLLTELGMPKNLAKTLIYISQVDECRSSQIERGTALLQPQVSVVMQELRRKGWVKKRHIKKRGKGRPVHHYRLSHPLPKILKRFEEEKVQEVETIKKNLSELEHMLKAD